MMWILTGEGIECEFEAQRFFTRHDFGLATEFLPLPRLLTKGLAGVDLKRGDWIFLPGGFSFADHFGSGKLLAYQLRRTGLLDQALKVGAHLMGICNGFQVLAETQLFGERTRLIANEVEGRRIGFVNRWVKCESPLVAGRSLRLCVRHGEGRLSAPAGLPAHVRPILHYTDEIFSNGSFERVAGLEARVGESRVLGIMPHPEVGARPIDDPDAVGAETFPQYRSTLLFGEGDGLLFMKALLKENLTTQ